MRWIPFCKLVACVCALFWALPGHASTDLVAGVAYGDEDSLAYELTLRHVYSPWVATDRLELAPVTEAGLFLWNNSDDTLWGGGVSVGLRLAPAGCETWRPFLMGTFGGVAISQKHFDTRALGTWYQFRSRASLGLEFGDAFQHSLSVSYTHYSNASTSSDNAGYNTVGLMYAYSF